VLGPLVRLEDEGLEGCLVLGRQPDSSQSR
jgi:hypothetical protein